MSDYTIRGLSDYVITSAKARASKEGTPLDDILSAFLLTYVSHGRIQSRGGHARKKAMTAEQRRASARKAARARWGKVR